MISNILLILILLNILQSSCKKPNIIYILSDDYGYGDFNMHIAGDTSGRIFTPNINKLAESGKLFTNGYSGSSCTPSRCMLMTGKHTGRSRIRGNSGSYTPLRDEDVTVAELCKNAGYHTGLVGKWGLGDYGSQGYPTNQGFDEFIGETSTEACQKWYPKYVQKNDDPLYNIPENNISNWDTCGPTLENCKWANDLWTQWGIDFIKGNYDKDEPFFLYLSSTTPHFGQMVNEPYIMWPVPWSVYQYTSNETTWPIVEQNFTAAVIAQDNMVGAVMDLLNELKIEEETVVFFSGDNGPDGFHDFDFEGSTGPYRGAKFSLHDAGVKQNIIVSWPGKIEPGTTTDHPFTFWDFLPTVAEIVGEDTKDLGIDGVSVVPTLLGEYQEEHSEIYYEQCWIRDYDWNAYETGWQQSYYLGNYKGIRVDRGDMFLYNIANDIAEEVDIAHENPEICNQIAKKMDENHVEDPFWPSTNDYETNPCCDLCEEIMGCVNCPKPDHGLQVMIKILTQL